MLKSFCFIWAVFALLCASAGAAEPSAPPAFIAAPPCSKRPGVRATRSDLIQFGEVTASLSAQSTREGSSCVQNAALWVTQKGASQEFELPDASAANFSILDISPDSSTILLASNPIFAYPEDDNSAQIAVLSFTDGALKWHPVYGILGFKNCDAILEPLGYLDAGHILISALPATTVRKHPTCTDRPLYFSFDIQTHAVKSSPFASTQRNAQPVAGPIRSCKTDPDVVAACYTARARLSVLDHGEGMIVWPVGGTHLMAVEEGMLPSNLASRVNSRMRVYATMVICPLTVEEPGPRPHICIDAATDFKPDPLPAKPAPVADKPAAAH